MSTPRRGREGGLDKPRVRRGVAKLHHSEGLNRNVAVLCRGVATVHSMKIFVFFFFSVDPWRGMSTLRRGREGGLDKPRVRRGVAKLHHSEGLSRNVAVLCRDVATVHSMKIFVFFFFPLLRGLVYWTNEDPISV